MNTEEKLIRIAIQKELANIFPYFINKEQIDILDKNLELISYNKIKNGYNVKFKYTFKAKKANNPILTFSSPIILIYIRESEIDNMKLNNANIRSLYLAILFALEFYIYITQFNTIGSVINKEKIINDCLQDFDDEAIANIINKIEIELFSNLERIGITLKSGNNVLFYKPIDFKKWFAEEIGKEALEKALNSFFECNDISEIKLSKYDLESIIKEVIENII